MMKKISARTREESGAALFLAVVFVGFILAVTTVIAKVHLKELQFGSGEIASNMAIFAADAGIERALYEIYRETGVLPDTCTNTGCFLPGPAGAPLTRHTLANGSSFHVIVPHGSSTPVVVNASTTYVVLRSIGKFGKVERSLEVNLYKSLPGP